MAVKYQPTIEVDGEMVRLARLSCSSQTFRTKEVAVRACMARLLRRYDEVYARQLYRPDGSKPHHFTYVRDWFKARHDTLRREFAEAVNEDERILGKQWHYDYYINRSTYGWGSR